MKLKNQFASPEISKKLQALGVREPSEYYWCSSFDGVSYEDILATKYDKESGQVNSGGGSVPAYSVAELGEMFKDREITTYTRPGAEWTCESGNIGGIYALNEADARGKMLIHLIENENLSI